MAAQYRIRQVRTIGALLGVHAGDSLGATFEFMSHTAIKREYPHGIRTIQGGGTFNWPAGHATDDTDLTRAVLLAYHEVASKSSHSQDADVVSIAARNMLAWLDGDWPDRKLGSSPVDVGMATRIGLEKYRQSGDPRKAGAGKGSAGNGSLMRCIPTGLFQTDKRKRVKEAMEISAVTHNDMRCTVSCAAYCEIVAAIVQDGLSVKDAIAQGITTAEHLDCPAVVKAIQEGRDLPALRLAKLVAEGTGPSTGLPMGAGGYVLDSLTLAISAMTDSRNLVDVLVDVTRVGMDTDTNAAIAGGLLGARDGVEAIPQDWRDVLQFSQEFKEVGEKLLESTGDE